MSNTSDPEGAAEQKPVEKPVSVAERNPSHWHRFKEWLSSSATIITNVGVVTGALAAVVVGTVTFGKDWIKSEIKKEVAAHLAGQEFKNAIKDEVTAQLQARKDDLKNAIKEEVRYQNAPGDLWADGVANFTAGDEERAFRCFDSAISMYEERKDPELFGPYEAALHNYFYYLSIAKRPELHMHRLDRHSQRVKDSTVSIDLNDQIDIAWFQFNSDRLLLARTGFEAVEKTSSIYNDQYTEAAAAHGLFYCFVAEDDPARAVTYLLKSVDLDPNRFGTQTYSKTNPDFVRYEKLYPGFAFRLEKAAREAKRLFDLRNGDAAQVKPEPPTP